MDLVRAIGRNQSDPTDAVLNLAGQTLEKVTRMVGAHSNHLFRCGAQKERSKDHPALAQKRTSYATQRSGLEKHWLR